MGHAQRKAYSRGNFKKFLDRCPVLKLCKLPTKAGQCGNFVNCAPKLTFQKFICIQNLHNMHT